MIGTRLKMILRSKGLSQQAFADALSVSQSFVNNIMSGKKDISGTVLVRISEVYPDVNLNWLLCGTGSMYLGEKVPESTPVQEFHIPGDLRNWMDRVEGLLTEIANK